MTTREQQGGREETSTQDNIKQQLQHSSEQIGDKARSVAAGASDALSHATQAVSQAKDQGAALLHDARDAASDSYESAREYAIEGAQELGYRARRAGQVSVDYARRAGGSTAAFVSANALPLTLIGAGVGWLAWTLRKQNQRNAELELDLYGEDFDEGLDGDYPIRERYAAGDAASGRLDAIGARGVADQAKQRVGALAERASESATALRDRASEGASALRERATHGAEVVRKRVGETAAHLSEQASEFSHEARVQLRNASLRTRDFADENPLMVGAIAVAAGLGVGLLLPNTQPENRLLGETRDRLLGDARGLIGDARDVLEDARETARDTAGQIGQKARETAQDVRNAVSDSRISH